MRPEVLLACFTLVSARAGSPFRTRHLPTALYGDIPLANRDILLPLVEAQDMKGVVDGNRNRRKRSAVLPRTRTMDQSASSYYNNLVSGASFPASDVIVDIYQAGDGPNDRTTLLNSVLLRALKTYRAQELSVTDDAVDFPLTSRMTSRPVNDDAVDFPLTMASRSMSGDEAVDFPFKSRMASRSMSGDEAFDFPFKSRMASRSMSGDDAADFPFASRRRPMTSQVASQWMTSNRWSDLMDPRDPFETSDVARPLTSRMKSNAVEKRRGRRCDFSRISLEMILDYFRNRRVCGVRVSRMRFGLGGKK